MDALCAIRYNITSSRKIFLLDKGGCMTMEYKDLIESKNSVRDYKEKEVDAATVKKIRGFCPVL